jgi:hypothetical protein
LVFGNGTDKELISLEFIVDEKVAMVIVVVEVNLEGTFRRLQ